jgi:hypothetical protein
MPGIAPRVPHLLCSSCLPRSGISEIVATIIIMHTVIIIPPRIPALLLVGGQRTPKLVVLKYCKTSKYFKKSN